MSLAFGECVAYPVLMSSVLAYGVSAIVCTSLTLRSREKFDFELIGERVTNFQECEKAMGAVPSKEREPVRAGQRAGLGGRTAQEMTA